MKKLCIAAVFSFIACFAFGQNLPVKPSKLVNDYTGTLSAQQLNSLERKLVAFDDSTSTQIAIAIVKTVGDYDINEYALELGRKWGVGGAKNNNGVMIVVALGDRKISIQTGYGLEGVLPDVYAKRIIENDIKPFFKQEDYYGGLESGTNAIISYTKGEYKQDKPRGRKGGGIPSAAILLLIIVIIVILIKRGGGGGGGRQVIGSRGVADALFWSMLLGGGRSSGHGGGWGGGSSGGGFGGFGGGSFGGGGSSGSW
ncbi:TPM domain-containing protein [Pedobacter faecalis]|uniref:TPM domain-containing protein n=1 Tax=Pedobacter faecalis TaxID=3041495 RepID=UPI00254C9430|nr:TPM domain-containing protein [Pedobacter sp. ELA7]